MVSSALSGAAQRGDAQLTVPTPLLLLAVPSWCQPWCHRALLGPV